MRDISGLTSSLNKSLGWNKTRINCFAHLILGMIGARTVNLQEIALTIPGGVLLTSRYRRLQRFFALFKIDFIKIARLIFQLYANSNNKYYLLIDRTNWYWGKKKINVFMLSIAHEGIAIPLFWQLLDKAGSSNYEEQRKLIGQYIKTFGTSSILGVLGDREFANGKLFSWLNRKKVPFNIRIKEGSQLKVKGKKLCTAKKLFKGLNPKEKNIYAMDVDIFGANVFLAGSRSERGELMIVATNQSPKNTIEIYLRRWEIESLFQNLKGRGFQFEKTHMTELYRIEKLVAVLAVAFAWANYVGEWRAAIKPIIFKIFRDKRQRPQNSFFRYGLDYIREAIFQGSHKEKQLKECIKLLSSPLYHGALL